MFTSSDSPEGMRGNKQTQRLPLGCWVQKQKCGPRQDNTYPPHTTLLLTVTDPPAQRGGP